MENQEKHICENCGKEHDGSYGSGRFCSKSCANARHFDKNVLEKIYNSRKQTLFKQFGYRTCVCGKCFESIKLLKEHKKVCNESNKKESRWISRCENYFASRRLLEEHMRNCNECKIKKYKNLKPWNKGLTKENDIRIKIQADKLKEKIQNGEINLKGRCTSEETRKKISESMKKAHKENRAYNIGTSRHNFEPSYPEKWFMEVIENEFENKNYIKEYVFHKFRLDFAWVEEKICIEIDGEQHERFEEQKIRDAEKDRLLLEEGWKELRIKWKDCIKNKKEWIEKAKALFN